MHLVVFTTYDSHAKKYGFPQGYPHVCEEIYAESVEAAKSLHPGKHVMTLEQFQAYKEGFHLTCEHIIQKALAKKHKPRFSFFKKRKAHEL